MKKGTIIGIIIGLIIGGIVGFMYSPTSLNSNQNHMIFYEGDEELIHFINDKSEPFCDGELSCEAFGQERLFLSVNPRDMDVNTIYWGVSSSFCREVFEYKLGKGFDDNKNFCRLEATSNTVEGMNRVDCECWD